MLFCLPQKVHKKVNPNLLVEPHAIRDCLKALRPYHALLLLHDEKELLEQLPIDANAALKKIIVQASPLKNFVTLAADTAISKLMVSPLFILIPCAHPFVSWRCSTRAATCYTGARRP